VHENLDPVVVSMWAVGTCKYTNIYQKRNNVEAFCCHTDLIWLFEKTSQAFFLVRSTNGNPLLRQTLLRFWGCCFEDCERPKSRNGEVENENVIM